MMQSTSVTLLLLLGLGAIQHAESAITSWKLDSGTAITTADATFDETVAENSAISYTFEAIGGTSVTLAMTMPDNTNLFTFTPATTGTTTKTGVLTLTTDAALDFETATSHTVKITATDTDGNGGTETGVATLTIRVTNVNEAPTFAESTISVSVTDGTDVGGTVYRASASDVDAGDSLEYALVSGTNSNHFSMATSGIMTVATQAINKTNVAAYELVVKATDSNTLSATATLSITVTDRSSSATRVSAFTSLMSVFLILPVLHIL